VHLLRRLLKVGTVADSMGAYVPAMVVQKALGFLRILLFAHMMVRAQMGVWGLGIMILTIASSVMTLGSSNGLVRYVSFYEARGRLREFYRLTRRAVSVCGAMMLLVALLASPLAARLLAGYGARQADPAAESMLSIWMVAMANAFLLALHSNMIGFMVGMRAYRLASAVELLFTAVFTLFSVVALAAAPTGLTVMLAHLAALAASLAAGMRLLHAGVAHLAGDEQANLGAAATGAIALEPHVDGQEITHTADYPVLIRQPAKEETGGIFWRIVRFGLVAMIGNFLWQAAQYVSFFITYRRDGQEGAGVFAVFLQLSQPTLFLANAAWAVIFSHVAKYWESGLRRVSVMVLETAYKAIVIIMMALTVAVYVSAPLWGLLLPPQYRVGLGLVGGLLAFSQVVINVAIMATLAKLREQPSVIAFAAVAGAVANVILAFTWRESGETAAESAAWAAGFGMFIGTGAVTLVYFLAAGIRPRVSTCFVFAAPAMLLATRWSDVSVWAVAALWAVVCVLAVFTPLLFDAREKQVAAASAKRILALARRALGRC